MGFPSPPIGAVRSTCPSGGPFGVSTIWRAPHDGQKPRHLREKARDRPGQVLVSAAVALYLGPSSK